MNRLIAFAVYHRRTVVILTLLLVALGVWGFVHLPMDAVPDITSNQVQVNTTIDGLGPEEIERRVTFPVESSMRGLPGVSQVRSLTRFGLSQVTVVFRDEMDVYRARQMVAERLQSVQLPPEARALLGPISLGLGEIFHYVLDVENPAPPGSPERFIQLTEIRSLQDWFVKPRLLTVEGVAEVNTSGGYERQYHVQPHIRKLAQYGLHFDDLLTALQHANQNVGGSYVNQTAEQFLIQGVGLYRSLEDIRKTPVKRLESFQMLRVGDVADVRLGKELRTGAATFEGRESVLGTVMMLIGENSRTVSHRVAEKIASLQKDLPKGFVIRTVYDRADLVGATLDTVLHNLLTGAALVLLVLMALLGNLRAALITALTIPLALLSAFALMKPLGMSGNLMSLGALDFGIIVDGTVIVLDHCVRHIEELRRRWGRTLSAREIQDAVYEATVQIRSAAGFGELIIVVVFLPLFGLTGVEGKMFHPMAGTFAAAVFAALLLSFTVAPALASWFLNAETRDREPRLMRACARLYRPLLERALARPRRVVGVAIFCIVGGLLLLKGRGAVFLPQLNEGSFAFHVLRPVNSSLDQSVAFQELTDRVILEFPEVATVFSRMGTSEVATDPMGPNMSDTYIMLKERSRWPAAENGRRRTFSELASALVERLEVVLPGQHYMASQPIQMRFNELLEGTRADVALKIYGPDLPTLMSLSQQARAVMLPLVGSGDVEMDLADTSPVLKIEARELELAQVGGRSSDVLDTVAIALGGAPAGYLFEKDRRYPILVRLPEEQRSNLQLLRALPVGVAPSVTVPLSSVATLSFAETFGTIQREKSARRAAVLVNLRDRDTEGFVRQAQQAVQAQLKVPEGYYLEWSGNFKNLQKARLRLLILAPLSLLIVIAMVYAAFQSLSQTFLVLMCVPLAWVGGVLGLVVRGLPFSISAGVGFIALSGIAVLNGVVLLNCFNDLARKGLPLDRIVREGAETRLRPVLMTALVASLGFLPMTLSQGLGAEVQRPLASVVMGGILTSTALTLVLLPVLYSLLYRRRETCLP